MERLSGYAPRPDVALGSQTNATVDRIADAAPANGAADEKPDDAIIRAFGARQDQPPHATRGS
jgi:hypothetical protein